MSLGMQYATAVSFAVGIVLLALGWLLRVNKNKQKKNEA